MLSRSSPMALPVSRSSMRWLRSSSGIWRRPAKYLAHWVFRVRSVIPTASTGKILRNGLAVTAHDEREGSPPPAGLRHKRHLTPARGRCHACQGDFRNCRRRAIDPADERLPQPLAWPPAERNIGGTPMPYLLAASFTSPRRCDRCSSSGAASRANSATWAASNRRMPSDNALGFFAAKEFVI
jgi:hypothetical protein